MLSRDLTVPFHAVLSPYNNFLCSPRNVWELLCRPGVLMGTFCAIPGPYGNFLWGPESIQELSVGPGVQELSV